MKFQILVALGTGILFLGFAACVLHRISSRYDSFQTEPPGFTQVFDASHLLTNVDKPPQTKLMMSKNAMQNPFEIDLALREACDLIEQGKLDVALQMLNSFIQDNPSQMLGYNIRGSLYCQKKLWISARQDFSKALELDPNNSSVKFNLVEIDFMQKNYDAARVGFAALKNDHDVGDVSSYRLFLCDLLQGHQKEASQELDAFNLADLRHPIITPMSPGPCITKKPTRLANGLRQRSAFILPLRMNFMPLV